MLEYSNHNTASNEQQAQHSNQSTASTQQPQQAKYSKRSIASTSHRAQLSKQSTTDTAQQAQHSNQSTPAGTSNRSYDPMTDWASDGAPNRPKSNPYCPLIHITMGHLEYQVYKIDIF